VSTFRHIILPAVGVVLFAVFVEFVKVGGAVCLLAVAALTLSGLIFGQRLPLALRIFSTGLMIYFGYSACLSGRAMAPNLTEYTIGTALHLFSLMALVPFLSLLRLWSLRVAVALIGMALPFCFGLAFLVADIEERLFVRRYQDTGVGPTARWTDSSCWLSYDAQSKRLEGSD
jgi:hypothetical protein